MDIQQAVPVNANLNVVIAQAVENPSLANSHECAFGSKINGIYITAECVASETSTTATPNFYWYMAKNPGGNLTLPNGNAVGVDDNKRFVIHQEMVMINALDGGNPRNIFKGVIVIPKGYRRMGPNDQIKVYFFIPSTGVAVNMCIQAHYKEFR